MQLKIGNVTLKNNLILAPMAGVTTDAFRKICLEHHAGLTCSEMVSDKGIFYRNEKSLEMLTTSVTPNSLQIFGNDIDTLTSSAKFIVDNYPLDILDINMGCPVNKVIKNGSGSALLKDPNKVYQVISSIKEVVDVPVTVKIRAGFDHNTINCDKVAKMAYLAGADAITIHGRTRSDMYNGQVNLDYIKMVRDNFSRVVIGNGDISSIKDAERMFEVTGVDAIMVGRAALGNPFIFDQLDAYFTEKKIIDKPSPQIILDTLLQHAKSLMLIKPHHIAMIEMRSHAAWYLKQIPYTKQYRSRIVSIKTYNELEQIVLAIRKMYE